MDNNTSSGFTNKNPKLPFFGQATSVNSAPTMSMIEPSNPEFKAAWENQYSAKPSPRWLKPVIISLAVLLIVIIVIIVLSQKPTPKESKTENSSIEDDASVITDDTVIDEDLELNKFFFALAEDPDSPYMPDFSKTNEYYHEAPTIPCGELTEVPHMNQTMLNLYLDSASVVVISDRFDETRKAIMIYGGLLTDSVYNVRSISCINSSDENLKNSQPSEKSYTTTGSEIFDNLSSERHFYVWTDVQYKYSGD